MSCSTFRVKVPGKLMIAGEYAVLEPKQKSVVVAVDRYITVYIEKALKNHISIPMLGLEAITWGISDEKLMFSIEDPRLCFIKKAILVARQFLEEKSEKLFPFKLKIESELEDPATGEKYGLGSSAAIVVAIISAMVYLFRKEKETITLEDIFKLSSIAHFKTQKSGSCADIAASVYGGWLKYSAFSGVWLLSQLEKCTKLTDIIDKPWPNLSVQQINSPTELQLLVGWTKSAVKTSSMIKKVDDFREQNLEEYNKFIENSSTAVEKLIKSFEENDLENAISSLAENRIVLKTFGERSGIPIETRMLERLCYISELFGSGKSSGAGGGDCGIAFLRDESSRKEVYKRWEEAGIKPLEINVSGAGVLIENKI